MEIQVVQYRYNFIIIFNPSDYLIAEALKTLRIRRVKTRFEAQALSFARDSGYDLHTWASLTW